MMADTATRFGLFLTALFPLCLAAYVGVLIGLYATRPVVITTRSESTFFTTASVTMNCSCAPGLACLLNHTYLTDNELSTFCASSVFVGNFSGSRKVPLCYAVRSSEKVYLEIPLGCQVSFALEARTSSTFNFSNPDAAVQVLLWLLVFCLVLT